MTVFSKILNPEDIELVNENLPNELNNIITKYVNEIEHTNKFEKCLNHIKNLKVFYDFDYKRICRTTIYENKKFRTLIFSDFNFRDLTRMRRNISNFNNVYNTYSKYYSQKEIDCDNNYEDRFDELGYDIIGIYNKDLECSKITSHQEEENNEYYLGRIYEGKYRKRCEKFEDKGYPFAEDYYKEIIHEENIEQTENVCYEKLKVIDLKRICKERGLKGYYKLRKNELIEFIKKND